MLGGPGAGRGPDSGSPAMEAGGLGRPRGLWACDGLSSCSLLLPPAPSALPSPLAWPLPTLPPPALQTDDCRTPACQPSADLSFSGPGRTGWPARLPLLLAPERPTSPARGPGCAHAGLSGPCPHCARTTDLCAATGQDCSPGTWVPPTPRDLSQSQTLLQVPLGPQDFLEAPGCPLCPMRPPLSHRPGSSLCRSLSPACWPWCPSSRAGPARGALQRAAGEGVAPRE